MSSDRNAHLDNVDLSSIKPKRVLTEAQRLAFLKGRETRMANLEKKRLEKEEALFATMEDTQVKPVTKTRKPRVKKIEPEPIQEQQSIQREPTVVEESKEVLEQEEVPNTEHHSPAPATTPSASLDVDKIANIVADQVYAKMKSEKATKKPSRNTTKNTTEKRNKIKEVLPDPPINTFAWI